MTNPIYNRFQLSTVQLINNQTKDASARVGTLAAEVSSGGSGAGYDSVQDVNRFLSLKNQQISNQSYLDSISVQKQRLDMKATCIQNILDLAIDMKQLVSGAGILTDQIVFQNQANFYLDQTQYSLNTQFLGSNLFGGTTLNAQVVSNLQALPGILPNSGPDTSYYQGNQAAIQIQVDEQTFQSDTLNASNPAFEQVIRALRLCRTATTNPPDVVALGAAQNLLDSGIQGLIQVQQTITTMNSNLDKSSELINDQELDIVQGIKDSGYRDITDALSDYTAQSALVRVSEFMSMNTSRRIEKLVNSLPN